MTDKAVHSFNIIKVRNTPNKVTLANGQVVYRQKDKPPKFFIVEYGAFIYAADYDNQFIFEVPDNIVPSPRFMCSCGSVAWEYGSKAYAHLGSPEGRILLCQMHLEFGKHADGSS